MPNVFELETGAQELLLFLNEPKSYSTLNLNLMLILHENEIRFQHAMQLVELTITIYFGMQCTMDLVAVSNNKPFSALKNKSISFEALPRVQAPKTNKQT